MKSQFKAVNNLFELKVSPEHSDIFQMFSNFSNFKFRIKKLDFFNFYDISFVGLPLNFLR